MVRAAASLLTAETTADPFPGTRIAQLHVVFRIPSHPAAVLFGHTLPGPLAYVEWFTIPTIAARDKDARMYKIARSYKSGRRAGGERERQAAVVELDTVIRSCHLGPQFSKVANRAWTSNNVLDRAERFLLNNFRDHHSFQTLY
jgi:hypothetical protein